MQNLRRANGRQIAIALIANHDAFRPAAFHRRGHCRGAAVRGLNIADIEVVITEDRATNRADENGAILNPKPIDGARQHLADRAVAASGAIVRLMLQLALALIGFVKALRRAMRHFVFRDQLARH